MFTFDQAGRRRDLVRHLPPPGEVAPWVEHLVVDIRPELERGSWRIVPDPCAHLLASFAPGERDRPGPLLHASVVGARARWIDADVTRRGLTVAVRLRPGALAALTGLPATDLSDRGIPLPEGFGGDGERACDALLAAATADEAVAALADLVVRRASRADRPDWRVRAVERALAEGRSGPPNARGGGGGAIPPGGSPRVSWMADRFGLSTRTLRQVAADAVGLSPRRWFRVTRLFRALELAGSGERRSWRWVAAHAGFHDPPHMTREFRALLGESPTRWLARRSAPLRTSPDLSRG